ncbi:MAG: DUF3108 domain-containing protein, partial [Betaproteobacteria bacterium]
VVMRNLYLTIVLSFAAAAVAAPPQRVEIGYEIQRNGQALAEVTQRLEHDGRTYRLSETWKGKGILGLRGEAVRSSQGAIAADGLRPQKFEDKRPGRETRQTGFDPAAKTATLLRQDQLSFIWTFAFAPPRDTVTASVADGKRVTSYTYQAAGREKLKTPAGEFDALKLVKRRDNPEDKVSEIWLAVDRQYIPVRILVVEKDGTRLDQVAVKISP